MKPLSIFYSYVDQDNDLLIKLNSHLAVLRQEGFIIPWHKRLIQAGQEWSREIDAHLDAADIILLLISAAFLDSGYCHGVEMKRALERHEEGSARVIPIILSAVDWLKTPFSHLHVLPTNGEPIVGSQRDENEAFENVARNIREIVEEMLARQNGEESVKRPGVSIHPASLPPGPAEPPEHNVLAQLEQLIQNFKMLRGQISDYWRLQGPKGFTLESCENQYHRLYADTMVFLANYLPRYASDDAEGFVAIVQGKSSVELGQRNNPPVSLARWIISPLAKFEKLAAQIDACAATLEFYKQKHFPASERSS